MMILTDGNAIRYMIKINISLYSDTALIPITIDGKGGEGAERESREDWERASNSRTCLPPLAAPEGPGSSMGSSLWIRSRVTVRNDSQK